MILSLKYIFLKGVGELLEQVVLYIVFILNSSTGKLWPKKQSNPLTHLSENTVITLTFLDIVCSFSSSRNKLHLNNKLHSSSNVETFKQFLQNKFIFKNKNFINTGVNVLKLK